MTAGLITIYALITGWTVLSVLMNGVRPSRSFAWILASLLIPFLGPFLYYLFGVNRRKFRFYKLKKHVSRRLYDETHSESRIDEERETLGTESFDNLATLITNSTKSSVYSGNKVAVHHSGKETFDDLFEAMEVAEHFIHIQYYIINNGEVLNKLVKVLEKKVGEGVEVRLMYDSIGTSSFSGKLKKRFQNIGVNVYPTMPLRLGNFMYTLNYRNHRKIVIIDGHTGFVGGVNISDKYIDENGPLGIWADLHLRIQGPAVDNLHRIFIKDYHFASGQDALPSDTYLPKIPEYGSTNVQIVQSGPDSKFPTILYQYLSMIVMAKKRICIANPYFIPGSSILNALTMASLSGVQVELLLPSVSDSRIAKYSMFSNFENLLRAGITIYLRKDFSHSKSIIIDEEIVSVGSGNFDYRSFEHNFEANALIYDTAIAKDIIKEFDMISSEIEPLSYKKYKKRPWTERTMEGFAKLFSPLL